MSKVNSKVPSEIRRAMRISTIEGTCATVFSTIAAPGSVFLTNFAIMLGAGPIHFGILSAIGQISQLFQILGVMVTKNLASRKNPTLWFLFAGRLPIFFLGILAFAFAKNDALWIFLCILFVSASLQAIGGNIWTAWFYDIIPIQVRGRFISRRSQYLIATSLLTGYIAGVFIDMFAKNPGKITLFFKNIIGKSFFIPQNLTIGYLVLFIFAGIWAMIGIKTLSTQPEKQKNKENGNFLRLLVEPLNNKNYRKFLGYNLWWMLAVGIAAPFWQPFMINKLKMSMVEIQLYCVVSTLTMLSVSRIWGNIIDTFGNKTAMRFALILAFVNPMIWVFVKPEVKWIVFIEAFTSGIMWSCANIVSMNFVLSLAPKDKVQSYAGICGAISGIGMVITILLSGFLLPPPIKLLGVYFEPEQILFFLTAVARLSTEIPLGWVDEPRAKPMTHALRYLHHLVKIQIGNIIHWFGECEPSEPE